jgi:DNA (cytosine-5)-methyltransferase 1
VTGATIFSGIHAPECAAPEIDWKFCAEIEPFPSAVGSFRHPHIPNLGDVTAPDFIDRARKALNGSTLDVLVFGSPCQGFSVAGKRLGLDDPRSNLALHALRIVRDLAPAWFCFENVPGLFSCWSGTPESPTGMEPGFADGGTYVREFIESSDFAEFLQWVPDIGYCGAWTVLDAQYFDLAQRRKRVFFVGHSGNDWRYSAAVLLEPESLCGNAPAREKAGERTSQSLEGRSGRSGANNFATSGGLIESSDTTGTLNARTQGGGGLGTDFDLGGAATVPALTARNSQDEAHGYQIPMFRR